MKWRELLRSWEGVYITPEMRQRLEEEIEKTLLETDNEAYDMGRRNRL